MTVLVIDNYDSFTYNLVQYLGELGCDIQVHRNDAVGLAEISSMKPDGIVISPGPGLPSNAGISVSLVQQFAGRTPILGVCLGHQAIGEAFGARVVRAPQLMHGKTSMIHHDHDSLLSNLSNPFEATRYHSLIVNRRTIPRDLEISAETGEGEIMGLRHRPTGAEGVQFHPESILTKAGMDILRNFLTFPQQP
ncbi:MAG: aminodeoxychorismate/anthranilate synthase component II [Acidobacteria bacterium]|nr:aminodeoxychorismate/anthranilate synthase component II [Acidobacteriota bacterium]